MQFVFFSQLQHQIAFRLELFNKRAGKVVLELQDFYNAFIDVLQFDAVFSIFLLPSAFELLSELSKNIVAFRARA